MMIFFLRFTCPNKSTTSYNVEYVKCSENYVCASGSANWPSLNLFLTLHSCQLFTLQRHQVGFTLFLQNQSFFCCTFCKRFPTLGQLFLIISFHLGCLPHYISHHLSSLYMEQHTLCPGHPLNSLSLYLSCLSPVPSEAPLEPGHEAEGHTFVERGGMLQQTTGHLTFMNRHSVLSKLENSTTFCAIFAPRAVFKGLVQSCKRRQRFFDVTPVLINHADS